MNYQEQLKDPRWEKKRKEILKRDNYRCTICNMKVKLDIHHLYYLPNTMIWDYDNDGLKSVCKPHHEILTFELSKLAGHIAFDILKGRYGI